MKIKLFRAITLLMLALCIGSAAASPAAAEKSGSAGDTQAIKVAFYPLDGFFEYDENGKECGYGVDYLNELKKYANVEWVYVPAESWESIKDMMLSGQADIRMPVSVPSSPSELFDYTVEPILMTYHAIMTRNDRTDLYYHDYERISGLKIGIADGQLTRTNVGLYLDTIGVMDNLVTYADYNRCKAALDAGEIDALISNIMDFTGDMKILDKFSLVSNCITTLKGSPYYTVINDAMTELNLANPSFQSALYERYYPERANEPFTREESEYIAKTDCLTMAVYTDRKPVSYLDQNGVYRGIAIEIANLLSEKIGIPFEFVPVTTATQVEMLENTDLVMPVFRNVDRSRYFVTNSFLDTEVAFAVRSGDYEPEDGAKVGVLTGTPGIRSMLESLDRFELVPYSSNRAALAALQRGKIAAFANSSYVINWMLENPRYEALTSTHYENIPLQYDICGHAKDTLLLSILNKGIRTISEDEQDAMILSGSKLTMDDFTVGDRLYIYRTQIVAAAAVLLLLFAAALIYNHTRTVYIREIKESNRKQAEASRAKSEFLARMSHDMRTPLNVIMGMTNLASENQNPDDTNQCLDKIAISSEFLLGLINDVLDMEHIESGKMTLHPTPYSSEEFTQYITAVIKPLCDQKNIDFTYTHEGPADFVVMQDKLRINQIYFNLLSNAAKFTPEGGKVTFHSRFTKTAHHTIVMDVTISDTGIGMTPEFMAHMFEPFTQESQEQKPAGEGTGLGLSIVKRICDLMGMTVAAVSTLGKGTTFTLHGEYEEASEPALPRTPPDMPASSDVDSVLKDTTVLVCEDHPLNQEIIRRLLDKKGVVSVLAENGKRGLAAFEQSAPVFSLRY